MTFTYEDVMEAARKVVAEKGGEYLYRESRVRCKYAEPDGSPSCLVGHVIEKLDPQVFERLAGREEMHGNSEAAGALVQLGWLEPDFWTDEAEAAMDRIQYAQDCGEPWGAAVERGLTLGKLVAAEGVRVPA